MLDLSETPEGWRLGSNTLKILKGDDFQPRNLYPTNYLSTVKEKMTFLTCKHAKILFHLEATRGCSIAKQRSEKKRET